MAKNNFKELPSRRGRTISLPPDKPSISYDSYKPIFSFNYMQYGSNTCLSSCDNTTKISVANKLLQLSQQRWSDILSTSKKSLGCERIPYDQLKKPLPSTITPEIKMTVFRLSSSARMVGLRRHDVYHIVQVSPNHDLY